MSAVPRSARFGESQEDYRKLAAFSGDAVRTRMDRIRDLIVEVRRECQEPDGALMGRARDLFPSPAAKSAKYGRYVDSLFGRRRGFADLFGAGLDQGYSALWLYTSNEGYDGPFTWAKNVFRSEESTADELRLATFLVELVNIDLFNYWWSNRATAALDDWVYRGLWMTARDFDDLEQKARNKQTAMRYRSIPLALDSSSTDPKQAKKFIEGGDGEVPVLQKIRLLGLSEASLACYRRSYPTSVVTTICATPVAAISAFPREGEVLLRGGVYQLLGVRPSQESFRGKPLRIVEMVTMTTNRDHPSTPQGAGGDAPRQLITRLISAERNMFCREHCRAEGAEEDAELYARALAGQEDSFRRDYGAAPPWLG